MRDIHSYAAGEWLAPGAGARNIASAITGEVIAQAGEFEVVKLILQQSIPYLVGGPSMMDIAVGNAVRAGRSRAGGYGK